MILIDNAYFGRALRQGRRDAGLRRHVAAKLLGVSNNQLHRYERSADAVPQNILWKLAYHAFVLMNTQNNGHRNP